MTTTAPSLAELLVPGELPIAAIQPAEDNLRHDVGDVHELAESIKSVGMLEPITVVRIIPGDGYQVVFGHRRLAAAQLAGLTAIPAIVRNFDNRERVEAMLIENLQRSDLDVLEEAEAYRRLMELGLNQKQLAKRIGRSQAHISKRLSLLKLPPAAQAYVNAGKLRLEDALTMATLETPQIDRALFEIEKLQFRRAGDVEHVIEKVARASKPKRGGSPNGKPAKAEREREWALSDRELIVFREASRHRITAAAAMRRLERLAGADEREWDRDDLAALIALAFADTKPARRRKTGR